MPIYRVLFRTPLALGKKLGRVEEPSNPATRQALKLRRTSAPGVHFFFFVFSHEPDHRFFATKTGGAPERGQAVRSIGFSRKIFFGFMGAAFHYTVHRLKYFFSTFDNA